MKIIVCGAGSVGRSIVGYLTQGNNDIVVIDIDPKALDDLSKKFDIQPVLGSASHPDVLDRAGADKADLLLSVTDKDEVNMISCQIAHSLFNVPQKIARVDSQVFSNPLWGHLYNDNNLPVDKIITPDLAIANAIFSILKVPGASEVLDFLDKRLYLLAFRCSENCNILKVPLSQLERITDDVEVSIAAVFKKGRGFIPANDYIFEIGDEVFFFVHEKDVDTAIQNLGFSQSSIEKIIIFGANQIADYLALKIEKDDNFVNSKIIDSDEKSTQKLSRDLFETSIIHGEMMSDSILEEARIDAVDATIAVTMRDKDNLIASLVAQKRGVGTTISLVNSRDYGGLLNNIGENILIDRSSVTISGILKELRKSSIRNAYSLGNGFGEIWELKAEEDDFCTGKKIKDLNLHANSKICAIMRDEEIIFPDSSEKIQKNDLIILYAGFDAIKKAESIFT